MPSSLRISICNNVVHGISCGGLCTVIPPSGHAQMTSFIPKWAQGAVKETKRDNSLIKFPIAANSWHKILRPFYGRRPRPERKFLPSYNFC
jgi:hypothetical protein